MHVVVESPTPVSEARRLLANVIVREALGAMSRQIESVRFKLPVQTGADSRRTCELQVRLSSGGKLSCPGTGECMADALESAAHAMRRRLFAELGLPLPSRARDLRA